LRVSEAQQWTIKDLKDNYIIVSAYIAKKSQYRATQTAAAVSDYLRSHSQIFELDKPISETSYSY
jgi:hypothetical protein